MRKRRRFTPEFKAKVVLDVLTGPAVPGRGVPQARPQPQPALASGRPTFLERAHTLFQPDEQREEDQARIAELERTARPGHAPDRGPKKSLDAAGCGLDQRRAVIEQLQGGYSDRLLCEALDVHRSSLYHEPRPGEDRPLREALIALAGRWPTYGYRRLTVMLRREGHTVNTKRVRRLMAELGLCAEPPSRHPRTTNSVHSFPRFPNLVESLEVIRPDQVWVSDITYIRLKKEFIYLAVLMDVFTRSIRGWNLGRSLEGELTLLALRRAMGTARPEIHHSDQGVQYAATAYVETLTAPGRRSAWRPWASRGRTGTPSG